MKTGNVKTIPIERMPVRSFLISPDGNSKIPMGMSVAFKGIAFGGYGRVEKGEGSEDNGKNWGAARLGEGHGPDLFPTLGTTGSPKSAGPYFARRGAPAIKTAVSPRRGRRRALR